MEILLKNKVFLIETLSADAPYILQHVVQQQIINRREYGNLNHSNHTAEKIVTNLLDIVMNRGETACAKFVDLLQQTEIQETFSMLKQLFSPAPTSHIQNNPIRTADEITEYKMSSLPRGFCLIINNIKFDEPNLRERIGSIADEESLTKVFKWLGYRVDVKRNQTAEQMKDLLNTYRLKDHNGDCFVCCIMSHGSENGVYGTDGAIISRDDIFGSFNGNSCPSLVNKPKVFFIQACRGNKPQLPVHVQSDSYEEMETEAEMKDEEMNTVKMITIPSDADLLVATSTIKGYLSLRDREKGSWFMQSLCEQLKMHCPMGTDVPTILLCVNKEVSENTTRLQLKGLVKQMPEHKVTLRKKLVFHVPNMQ